MCAKRKARVFSGTSGYSYQHWKEVFYPKGLRESAWLEYYAEHFNTVELNVTFYRLPKEETFDGWYRRTPKGFVFSVKGSRFITHIKKLKECAGPLKLFFARVKRLKEKLGPVLWQLPPSFSSNPERLERFLKALKAHKNIRQVFEFRNETWFEESVFDLLAAHNVSLCTADWPPCGTDHRVTGDFIYIRRHGTPAAKYGGCYPRSRLASDARTVREHIRRRRDVYLYFNNDAGGFAVKNACTVRALLERGSS